MLRTAVFCVALAVTAAPLWGQITPPAAQMPPLERKRTSGNLQKASTTADHMKQLVYATGDERSGTGLAQ